MRARTEIQFHDPRAGFVTVHASGSGAWIGAWMSVGTISDERQVTVFFGRGLAARSELMRLADEFQKAGDALLEAFEREEDERVARFDAEAATKAPGATDEDAGPFATNRAILKKLIGELEAGQKPPAIFGEELPPLKCTCPRNHGGRSATDPTCPLHAGDARD